MGKITIQKTHKFPRKTMPHQHQPTANDDDDDDDSTQTTNFNPGSVPSTVRLHAGLGWTAAKRSRFGPLYPAGTFAVDHGANAAASRLCAAVSVRISVSTVLGPVFNCLPEFFFTFIPFLVGMFLFSFFLCQRWSPRTAAPTCWNRF